MKQRSPSDIQLIGHEVAVRWDDGVEDFFPMETLRACSPSAENIGEKDLFGSVVGGSRKDVFPDVLATGFEWVGNYAVRFQFSDGHGSGLFTYPYLRRLGDAIRKGDKPDPRKLLDME